MSDWRDYERQRSMQFSIPSSATTFPSLSSNSTIPESLECSESLRRFEVVEIKQMFLALVGQET